MAWTPLLLVGWLLLDVLIVAAVLVVASRRRRREPCSVVPATEHGSMSTAVDGHKGTSTPSQRLVAPLS